MVSTRSHPAAFPPPEASPTKASPRKSRTSTPDLAAPPLVGQSLRERAVENGAAARAKTVATDGEVWCHTASNLTIAWLAVSIPLVIWDALYILLRPHTMAGGALQWPIWKPYEIYAAIDHVYGWPGWDNNDGFGGGQGVMNVIEVVLYGLYMMIVYNHGIRAEGGSGVQIGHGVKGWMSGGVKIRGRTGNKAVMIGFVASVMTLSKTYYAAFKNTAHNDWPTLILFYVVMNGLWVLFPTYMSITFGSDIFAALEAATNSKTKKDS